MHRGRGTSPCLACRRVNGQQVVMKQHFHSYTHIHTQGSSAFWLQYSGAFASLSLFLYGTGCFLCCATHTVTLSPAFVYVFCPHLLLAAFGKCVVGKCADVKGKGAKRAVLQQDKLECMFSLWCVLSNDNHTSSIKAQSDCHPNVNKAVN